MCGSLRGKAVGRHHGGRSRLNHRVFGGTGPQFKTDAIRSEGRRRLGNLSTPKSVQKRQMALHAKAKAEAGYRFYALYYKISSEDILAHAWGQCRSNRGAPGVDGQDFADIEAYGVQRRLGKLALALKNEEYRPDPHQESVHTEVQLDGEEPQAQAVGHLDLARSGG